MKFVWALEEATQENTEFPSLEILQRQVDVVHMAMI